MNITIYSNGDNMMKRFLRRLAVPILLAVSMVPVQPAEAAFTHVGDYYVCGVVYDALPTTKRGKYGYVFVRVSLGPGCSVTVDDEIYFNSTNASEPGTKWREAALMAILKELRQAQMNGSKVTLYFEPGSASTAVVQAVGFPNQ